MKQAEAQHDADDELEPIDTWSLYEIMKAWDAVVCGKAVAMPGPSWDSIAFSRFKAALLHLKGKTNE